MDENTIGTNTAIDDSKLDQSAPETTSEFPEYLAKDDPQVCYPEWIYRVRLMVKIGPFKSCLRATNRYTYSKSAEEAIQNSPSEWTLISAINKNVWIEAELVGKADPSRPFDPHI